MLAFYQCRPSKTKYLTFTLCLQSYISVFAFNLTGTLPDQHFGSHFTREETEVLGGRRTYGRPTTRTWREPGVRAAYLVSVSRNITCNSNRRLSRLGGLEQRNVLGNKRRAGPAQCQPPGLQGEWGGGGGAKGWLHSAESAAPGTRAGGSGTKRVRVGLGAGGKRAAEPGEWGRGPCRESRRGAAGPTRSGAGPAPERVGAEGRGPSLGIEGGARPRGRGGDGAGMGRGLCGREWGQSGCRPGLAQAGTRGIAQGRGICRWEGPSGGESARGRPMGSGPPRVRAGPRLCRSRLGPGPSPSPAWSCFLLCELT